MRRAVPALFAVLLSGCSTSLGAPSPTSTPSEVPAFGQGPQGPTQAATVVGITDGDTIKVNLDGVVYPLRYIGIDAPERGDARAQRATADNADLVDGRQVVLERDVSNTDRFDRLLRYVWLRQGADWLLVNRELVRLGDAEAKAYPPDTKYQGLLNKAETRARANKVGIWGGGGQVRPLVPPASTPKPHKGNCDSSYPGVCIPPYPPDLDCGDVPYQNFQVLPPDPHGFDAEGDGLGCETY